MKKLKILIMLIVLVMCLTACKTKEKIQTYNDEENGVSFEYSDKFEVIDTDKEVSLKINEETNSKIDLEATSCDVIMQNSDGEIILLKTLPLEEVLNTEEEIKNELEKQRQEYNEIIKIATNTQIVKNQIITINENTALDTIIESNGVKTRVILVKLKDKSIEIQYIAKSDKYNENNAKYLETIKI